MNTTDDATSGLSNLFISVSSLPDDGYGTFQLFFLTIVYAYLLFIGANLISDGSELLLLIPSMAGIVGSIVLPVLGAVPDGAIVLFSGLGSNAQYQLQVGIGALAGSTIMLLTIPWSLVVIAGRVDIDPKTAELQYKPPKLTPPDRLNLYYTGVSVQLAAKKAAALVLVTATSYLIIESAALYFRDDAADSLSSHEKPYAIATFCVAIIFLLFYLLWAYIASYSEDAQKERDEYLTEGIKNGSISLVGVVEAVIESTENSESSKTNESVGTENEPLLNRDDKVVSRLKDVLKPFFDKYDTEKTKSLGIDELNLLLIDLGEKLRPSMVKQHFLAADEDQSGRLDYHEFVTFALKYAREHPAVVSAHALESKRVRDQLETLDVIDDEMEEIPEEFISLSPEDQQFNIKMRAGWMLLLGTVIILIFSDAIVSCLSEIGDRIGIRPFYISFVLAPFVSNGSELVAAYNYASKKTARSVGISMATLLGAAIMNNTLVLAIFMVLIFSRGLYYEFFAETMAILFVEVVVALYTIRKDMQTVLDAIIILALYPLSLVVVYALYLIGWG